MFKHIGTKIASVACAALTVVMAVCVSVPQQALAYSAPTKWDDLSKTGYRPTDGIASFTYAYNNLTIDNVSITSGSDTWELRNTLSVSGGTEKCLCSKAKITSTGKQSLKAVTIFCKNSIKTVDGQTLNMELTFSPEVYISASKTEWGKNDFLDIFSFNYNKSTKRVIGIYANAFLYTTLSASTQPTREESARALTRITTTVRLLNQDGTVYNPSNRCAYYRFDDLDVGTAGWNSTGSTYKNSYTDFSNIGDGTCYNEGVQFLSGVQSINVQKENNLTISDSYSKYVAAKSGDDGSIDSPTNVVAVKTNATGFSFIWQGVNCGTTILTPGNYVQYRLVVKKGSSDSSYTRSRAGAVYGVYSDAACKNLLYSATCDEDGTAYVLEDGRALVYDTTYYLKEITAAPGYALDTSVYPFDAVSTYSYVTKGANTYDDLTVSVADDPLRMPFSFTKTDSAGGALTGATFSLVQTEGGTISKSVTSTAAGLVDFGNLNHGTYTLTETSAPTGYKASSGSWAVVVDGQAKTVTVAASDGAVAFTGSQTAGWKLDNDAKTLPFSFLKVDAADAAKTLDGAEFSLKGTAGTAEAKAVNKTAISGMDGKVDFGNLYEGTYTLTETASPYDYEPANTTWTVKADTTTGTVGVTADSSSFSYSTCMGSYADGYKITNTRSTVFFKFTKTDEGGFMPLEGASFELYKCSDISHTSADDHSETATAGADCCWDVSSPFVTVTSNEDGEVILGRLESGQYMLAETAAPSGYRLPHGQWMLDVDASNTNSLKRTINITARGTDLPPAFKVRTNDITGISSYSLPNYKEWMLPLSGGPGPAALVAGGLAFVGAGAIALTAHKKRHDDDDDE